MSDDLDRLARKKKEISHKAAAAQRRTKESEYAIAEREAQRRAEEKDYLIRAGMKPGEIKMLVAAHRYICSHCDGFVMEGSPVCFYKSRSDKDLDEATGFAMKHDIFHNDCLNSYLASLAEDDDDYTPSPDVL